MQFKILYRSAQPVSTYPSNISLRTTEAATFEELLSVMESMLSHSKVLLQSATGLSGSLIQCQGPPETLRLETDSTLLDTDEECSLQDLNALLEPCAFESGLGPILPIIHLLNLAMTQGCYLANMTIGSATQDEILKWA